jgi:hypothetical protein
MSKFSDKQNIKILWDVLLGELNMKNDNTNLVNNIRTIFESNIAPFIARMNPNSSLLNHNKLFLSQVVIAVNRLFPNLKQQQKMQKINISDEVLANTFNENNVQTFKDTSGNTLEHVNVDFIPFYNKNNAPTFKDTSGNILAPPLQDPKGSLKKVDFTLANTDSKITEMQLLIAETMAKRNFEVEQFEIINNSNLSSESETWLQSSNTSVKTDKQNALNETTKNVEQRKLKYNTFFTDERQPKGERQPKDDIQVPILNKKVTFHEELENNELEPNITLTIEETEKINVINEPSHNILNKLKKINNKPNETSLDKLSSQMEELNSKFDTLINLIENKLVIH